MGPTMYGRPWERMPSWLTVRPGLLGEDRSCDLGGYKPLPPGDYYYRPASP